MDDRELLELAAKAAGIGPVIGWEIGALKIGPNARARFWNPLTDDGDALRVAAKLRLDITYYNGFQEVHSEPCYGDGLSPAIEKYGSDASAATRRAIVRAAAEIGRSMP